MTRRLRAVPAGTRRSAPAIIDPPGGFDAPDPDNLTDDWRDGWQACREVLGNEWDAWYQRGLAARPVAERGVRLDVMLSATFAFVVGFVVAAALLA